jgi:tetratricopeptide (TPR) repeat protein
LLLAAEQGESVAGLELAWHCVRAGREGEATPHLLRGARESIEAGAPYQAEKALTEAHGWLPTTQHASASLLLAECLLEQGRTYESLQTLQQCAAYPDEQASERALLLNARARIELDPETADSANLLTSLLNVAKSGVCTGHRVMAGLLASSIAYASQDRACAEYLLELCSAFDPTRIETIDAVRLVCMKARALRILGKRSSLSALTGTLEALGDCMESKGLRGSDLEKVCRFLGNIHLSRGRYSEAIKQFRTASSLAAQLCEHRRERLCVASLALCYGRLGSYTEQVQLANRALVAYSPSEYDIERASAAYYLAWGLAMLGKEQESLSIVCGNLSGPLRPKTWQGQLCELYAADILQMCGRAEEAVARASDTLSASGWRVLARDHLGKAVRWLLRCCPSETAEPILTRELGSQLEALESCDLIDEAEVLAAIAGSSVTTPVTAAAISQRLGLVLAGLPPATNHYLRKLGVP